MNEHLADLLIEQARRTFIGREEEMNLLQTLDESCPSVTYLHGIGGIGKSRLLSRIRAKRACGRSFGHHS